MGYQLNPLPRALGGAVLATIALAATALFPTSALSAFPGENGKIAYRCASDICVTDPAGTVTTRLTTSGYQQNPSFSADGRQIAFDRRVASGEHLDVFVMRSDGTGMRRITRSSGSGSPTFLPGGGRIVYSGPGGIHTIKLNGTGEQKIGSGYAPAVSPDGQSVAFLRGGTGTPFNYPGLWVMGIDGADVAPVATEHNDLYARAPAWSPDADRILFDHGGLSTIRPDGSDLTQVSSDELPWDELVGEPTFAPDGQRIAYLAANCDPYGDCDADLVTQSVPGEDFNHVPVAADYGASPDWGPQTGEPGATGRCNGRQATIVGTHGHDVITGTAGRDVISARRGRDEIRALGGNDIVCGGRGADLIRGGKGRDLCRGGPGNDRLRSCERR